MKKRQMQAPARDCGAIQVDGEMVAPIPRWLPAQLGQNDGGWEYLWPLLIFYRRAAGKESAGKKDTDPASEQGHP
jgi:hypothetical protein